MVRIIGVVESEGETPWSVCVWVDVDPELDELSCDEELV